MNNNDYSFACWAIPNENNQMQIFAPDGSVIFQEWSRIETKVNYPTMAIVKLVVNVAKSKEDMMDRINKLTGKK